MVAAAEAIPFTVEVRELTSEVRTFEVTDEVVAATPLTVVVMTLPVVVAEFVVDEATIPERSVVVAIPFTIEVRMVPEAESAFEFTAVVVDVTPFTSEVMTFPAEVSVLLPMTDDVADTPLMVVVRTLPVRL